MCHKLDFVNKLKNPFKVICTMMSAEPITDEQLYRECIKSEIGKFFIHFSKKTLAKTVTLENKRITTKPGLYF